MTDIYKLKPKKATAKNKAMSQTIKIETSLPKEHEPAVKAAPQRQIKTVQPADEQRFIRQYPVRTTDLMFDRMTIAVATEGVKRGQPGKHGFNKTTMANEAFEMWLKKYGY